MNFARIVTTPRIEDLEPAMIKGPGAQNHFCPRDERLWSGQHPRYAKCWNRYKFPMGCLCVS